MGPEKPRDITELGYQWNSQIRKWEKVLQDEILTIPTLGEGHYSSVHSVHEDEKWMELKDSFVSEVLHYEREINPYPPVKSGFSEHASVRIRTSNYRDNERRLYSYDYQQMDEDSPGKRNSAWTRKNTVLNVSSYGRGSVSYSRRGTMQHLNVCDPTSEGFLSFNFQTGLITDSEDKQLGNMRTSLDSEGRFHYDERYYIPTQEGFDRTVRIQRPGKQKDLVLATAPARLQSINLIEEIFIRAGVDWLRLDELIPLRFQINM